MNNILYHKNCYRKKEPRRSKKRPSGLGKDELISTQDLDSTLDFLFINSRTTALSFFT